jgi:hypothetical protein
MFNDFWMKFEDEEAWQLKYLHVFHGISIANSENEYKQGKKMTIQDPEFSFKVDQVKGTNYHILQIKSKEKLVQIRAQEKISLEYIIYNSEQSHERDMGRPMTFVPHLINVDSVLDANRVGDFKFNGIINLVVVALIFSHLRLMFDNFKKSGLLLSKEGFETIFSHDNVLYVLVSGGMTLSSIFICYTIEKLAPLIKVPAIINLLHTANITYLLSCPFVISKLGLYNPALGCMMLTLVTMICLKLFSYLHFWDDVRKFISKRNKLTAEAKKRDSSCLDKTNIANKESMYEEIENIINEYPNNVRLGALIEFLFMPVLCFQYKFPRTKEIRISYVLNYAIKVIVCLFLQL